MEGTRSVTLWLRLAGELVVIVAGVLIALAADSWIDLRRDRDNEIEHLAALANDFKTSLTPLENARDYKKKQIADIQRFLTDDVWQLPTNIIEDSIYDGVYVTGGYVPVLSALRDIESTGDLSLIKDSEIRRGLALLGVRLERLSRSFNEYIFYHQTIVDPFIANELPAVKLLASRSGVEAAIDEEPDWSPLSTSRAKGILVFKLSLASNYVDSLEALQNQFEALVILIEQRLGELNP